MDDDLLHGVSHGALYLGILGALATRIEPQLLRQLRLQIAPTLDAATEAELWFSRLTEFRAPTGLVLSRRVLPILRERLASDPDRLEAAWRVIATAHASSSPALRVEEELTYIALRGIDSTALEDRARELLRQLIRTLVERRSTGLAEWASRALPRLPHLLTSLEEARMLAHAAARRLGRIGPIAALGHKSNAEFEEWAWLSSESLQHLPMSVRLVEGGIEFGPRGLEQSHPIEVPALIPLAVRIWPEGSGAGPGVDFPLQPTGRHFFPIDSATVEVQLLGGARFSLKRPGQPNTIHDRLAKLRSPRTNISYMQEREGGEHIIELPFVVGVMGDFAGEAYHTLVPFEQRKFKNIDIDNFDAVMSAIRPIVNFDVHNVDGEPAVRVELELLSMAAFSPENIANKVGAIRVRVELRDSIAELRDRYTDLEFARSVQAILGEADLSALAGRIQTLMKRGDATQTLYYSASGVDTTIESLRRLLGVLDLGEGAQALTVAERLVQAAIQGAMQNGEGVIAEYLASLDNQVNTLLDSILHHPKFQRLESSWRGLYHLVANTETGDQLKIRVLQLTKEELKADLVSHANPTASVLAKKVYEEEYGMLGGQPYAVLIGDYYWNNTPDDVVALTGVSSIAALCFAPFLSSVSGSFFGVDSFANLNDDLNLQQAFESTEYSDWREYRDTDNSAWVGLTLPRTLARLPYGAATHPLEGLRYEEATDNIPARRHSASTNLCWMNTAYVYGARLTASFAKTGLCLETRGAEGGGKVFGLPEFLLRRDDGVSSNSSSEVDVTEPLEARLSSLGFLPLCHYKDRYPVFIDAASTQRPRDYDSPGATANALIASRLPYRMVVGRFAHYLMCIMRDRIGVSDGIDSEIDLLNRWISNYVNANDLASREIRARYPLREAHLEMEETTEQANVKFLVAYLRPWINVEELETSLRVRIRIPPWYPG